MANVTKVTKKDLFLKAYKSNMGHISKACEAIKITRTTYYRWYDKFSKFKQKIDDIDESFIDLAECALRKNIKKRMQRAIEFYLCNKKKGEYSHTFKGELTGAGGEPIRYIIEPTYEKPDKGNTEEKEGEIKEQKELKSGEYSGL